MHVQAQTPALVADERAVPAVACGAQTKQVRAATHGTTMNHPSRHPLYRTPATAAHSRHALTALQAQHLGHLPQKPLCEWG